MLLVASLALAAPLAPTGLSSSGVEVSAFTGARTAWLTEAGCDGPACDAWRADTVLGGEVGVGLARPVGVYLHGAWVRETVDAALYAGDGYAFGGGVRGNIGLGRQLGVHVWAGLEHQLTATGNLAEQASVWQLDAGGVLRAGRVDEGLQAWVGAGVVPWSSQSATVLDGGLKVPLTPRFPVEAVAGVQIASDALFGPWDDRTRLAAGVSGSAGYRTGLTGFVTVLH